ncbi:hypothetical protein LWI28_016297 [Acer negundo]|uniref:B3 domain-containing protein n=1 Tax=Acer negundo TaxID=4023 RepID=A0AAD5J6L1_ACENE|nr:hypothetical protein LWI28_016297 [Acer negundo]
MDREEKKEGKRMMEKITVRDVVQDVNNPPIDKSFEELEEDVARRASDDAEASSLLKESVMCGFAWRHFHDIKSERLMKLKKEEKKEKEKEEEEEKDKYTNMKERKEVDFFVPKKKRFNKCNNNNNNEEKGTVGIIKNPKNCNSNNKDQKGTKGVKNKKLKRTINCARKNMIGLEQAPDIPIKMRKYIEDVLGGSDIKLFIMKQIFLADLEPHNNRISIPNNQVRDHSVLTEEEKEFIKINIDNNEKKNKEQNKPGLTVTLVEPEPTMEEHVQYLKTWNMNSTAYVLTHKWNSVVKRHEDVLKVGTIVQLWSFRRRQQQQQQQSNRVSVEIKIPLLQTNLSFALVIVDEKKGDGASTSGCGGGGDHNHHMIKTTSSPESAVTDQGAKD